MTNGLSLRRTEYYCKYYPLIDRFCVSKNKALNTLDYVIKSRFYKGFEYYRYIPGPDTGLREAENYLHKFPNECCFEITKSCNLHCRVCISGAQGRYAANLSSFKIADIIEKYRFPRITLTGGEPTLHRDLLKIVDISSKNAERVILSTNGTNLDLIEVAFSKVKNLILAISLHGPEEIHDEFVGIKGSFSKVIKCVHNATSCGIPVQVYSVISKATINSLINLCDIVKSLKITEHRLSLIKPEGIILGYFATFKEVVSGIKDLSIPYKISIKRRDQPFAFVNAFGKEEIKNVRRY